MASARPRSSLGLGVGLGLGPGLGLGLGLGLAGKHGFSTAKAILRSLTLALTPTLPLTKAIGQKPHPLGLYVKGSVTVGGRLALPGDGIRDAHSTWACLHEGDTWPHEWLVEPGSQPGALRPPEP